MKSETKLTSISVEVLDMRKPLPIDELVDALHDAIKVPLGRIRPGRTVRVQIPRLDTLPRK